MIREPKQSDLVDELNHLEDESLQKLGYQKVSYNNFMRGQKMQTLGQLREVKQMKILSNQYHHEQEEKMNSVQMNMTKTLKNMKKTNSELAEAYVYDTKSATSKITAGTTSTHLFC